MGWNQWLKLPKCPGITIISASLGQVMHRACARQGISNSQHAVKSEDFFLHHWQVLSAALETISKMTTAIVFLEIKNFSLGPNTPGCTGGPVSFLSLKVFRHSASQSYKSSHQENGCVVYLAKPSQPFNSMDTKSAPTVTLPTYASVHKCSARSQRKAQSSRLLSTCLETSLQQVEKATTKQNITEQTNIEYPNSFVCISIGELKLTPCIDYLGVSTHLKTQSFEKKTRNGLKRSTGSS